MCIVPRLEQDCCSEAITGGGGGVCTVQRLEQDCCVEATKRGGGVYGTKVGIRLLYRGYNRGGGGVYCLIQRSESH